MSWPRLRPPESVKKTRKGNPLLFLVFEFIPGKRWKAYSRGYEKGHPFPGSRVDGLHGIFEGKLSFEEMLQAIPSLARGCCVFAEAAGKPKRIEPHLETVKAALQPLTG